MTQTSEGEPDSFGTQVQRLGAERPGDVALRCISDDGGEQALTWQQLDARSSQVARGLLDRGVQSGDRVAVALQNSPELVTTILAAWKVGAVPVPLRWDLPDWEQARVLDVVGAAVTLGASDLNWLASCIGASRTTEAGAVGAGTGTGTGTTAAAGSGGFDAGPLPRVVSPQTHGICSSGSTGTPKVILAEKPALFDPLMGEPFPSAWGPMPRPQRILVPTQLYHTNGFAMLLNLLAGDEVTLLARFDAERLVAAVERHRMTTFIATPTMLQRVADLPGVDDCDLSSIAWVLQGAAVIAPSLVRRWCDLIGPERLFMAYGMTEGLGLAAIRADEWLDRPGSVGRGYRGTEIRILDPDGKEVPAGELGEIYLRSPMGGLYRYLGGATKLPMTGDGFGSVGDIGHLDDDGYLYVVDRRVDMIVTGGANVYPAEVESALADHPGIADVVVIGLSDPEWGRRVHAVVEAADPAAPPTADDVIAYAKARVASYKAPKTVEIVDAIPRSQATKVNRSALVAARDG